MNWEQQVVNFIQQTVNWNKEKSLDDFLSRSSLSLASITGAYLTARVEVDDDYSAHVTDAIPLFLNDLVLEAPPIRKFLAEHDNKIVFWKDIPAKNNVFGELLLALSSAVIMPVITPSRSTLFVLGWSEPLEMMQAFKSFIEIITLRLMGILNYVSLQKMYDRDVVRIAAIADALPHAVVFINNGGGPGWVNHKAAELMQIDKPGEQAPEVLAAAMAKVRGKAVNSTEINEKAAQLFLNPDTVFKNWIWQLPSGNLSVSTLPVNNQNINGRLWTFEEV